ncbi:S8 family serine peptidase [Brumimicrobium aurantiacum]|uniref:Peptidase S8 n=1 Tax=Brumimicrobium aurantiacum TaxID=1737063 RepID=A0A3E1EUV0_9FLAO|nr:S8 family serine peptidase [Brumimicrobium aurantiacum]RFC53282.1 peptidase S8 [Brumimicrobium aurantiacum]
MNHPGICSLFCLLVFGVLSVQGQSDHWHHLDPETNGVLGVSKYRAYELLKDKTPDTVIVAVVDNGVELSHDDLQGVIWVNPNEIPDNGIDDDQNGYVDDIHGWNFLGNEKGENLKNETTGLTRLYAQLHQKYKNTAKEELPKNQHQEYELYLKVKTDYLSKVKEREQSIVNLKQLLIEFNYADQTIKENLGNEKYTRTELEKSKIRNTDFTASRNFMLYMFDNNISKSMIEKELKTNVNALKTRLNPDFKNRENIVGDNPDDLEDTDYGNNMLDVRGPYHGTGVASIIGALNNDFGVDGLAKHVKLMILRVVPNGDERDKDIALAFRYAVQNGADIISCSFAKKYALHHDFVQLAIEEAEKEGVLIVNASGNSSENIDEVISYPTGYKLNGEKAQNYMVVGASRAQDDTNLVASFSNYGRENVDVFAPGFNIATCVLKNGYGMSSGTSDASPIVAGIAAVLKSYYSHLTASQLKEIIIRSVYIPKTEKVVQPGGEVLVDFNSLSVSGGIANLYRAVQLVEKEYLK